LLKEWHIICNDIINAKKILPNSNQKMTKTTVFSHSSNFKRVVALVYDQLCTFEFGIAAEVFGLSRPELDKQLYSFSSVALEETPLRAAGGLEVSPTGSYRDLLNADLIIIPGWRDRSEPIPQVYIDELNAAHKRGAQLLSICSGGYILAAAGLLSNRRATTHWRYADDFKTNYPDVIVQENEIYIDHGDVITSAGSSTGIDACLHIVRNDYGANVANSIARRLVMHSHRQGNQAQFIKQPLPKFSNDYRLSRLIDSVRAELSTPYTISLMAKHAGMSLRTFQRRFLALTGLPAMQWLNQERVSRSCVLLETTDLSVESICHSVGFNSSEVLRYHFRQSLDIGPTDYRKRFKAG